MKKYNFNDYIMISKKREIYISYVILRNVYELYYFQSETEN